MKNFKTCCLLLMLVFLSLPAWASSYEEIIATALESSLTVKSNELTYRNNLLSLEQSELEDEAVWTVSVAATPYGNSLEDESLNVSTAEVSVQLPDDGETTITLSSPFYTGYSDGAFSISPSVSASHTFNFNYYDDDVLDDLETELSRITTQRSYPYSDYSFRKTVVSAISTIVTLEQQIESLSYEQDTAKRDLRNDLLLGKTKEGAISYKQSMLTIEKNENSLDAYQKQLDNAKRTYLATVGSEWSGVEDLPMPSFALTIDPSGNSETESYRLEARIAEEEAKQQDSEINGSGLTLEGSAGYSYYNDDYYTYQPDTMDLGMGLTYSSRNLSLGMSAGMSFDLDDNWSASPVITLFGTWTTDSSKKSDRLELNKLRNEAIIASNDYMDARTDYINEALELQNRIAAWNFDYEILVFNEEYLEAMLDYTRQSFEAGLSTQEELDTAEHDLLLAQYDRTLLLLEGLDLEYDLAIFSL